MFNFWKHENKTEEVVQLGNELPGGDRSFKLGILFVAKHLNYSGKEFF